MNKYLFFGFLLAAYTSTAQIQFSSPLPHTASPPTGAGAPSTQGSRLRFDLSTYRIYEWSPGLANWFVLGQGIDVVSGSVAPAYTPTQAQSNFAINADNELFYYTGGSWIQINTGGVSSVNGLTGAVTLDLSLAGNILSITGDGTTVNLAPYLDNTDAQNLSWNSGTGLLSISGGTGANLDGRYLTAEVDGSVTNEAQSLSAGGTTSPTVTLSQAGGAGGGTVTYAGAGIVTLGQSAGTITITGTEVDGSVTNEAQSLSAGGTTSPTVTLSQAGGAGGGTVTYAGAGIVTLGQSGGTITITGTEVDGSTSNEIQALTAGGAGPTSYTLDLSNGGGAVTLAEGANVDLTRSGNTITIASTASGSGTTDLTFSGASSPVTLNSSTGTDVTITAGGINTLSATSGNVTITATEVDGSVTNEAQSLSAGGTTSPTVTLSQAGGAGGGTVTYAGAGIVTLGQSAGTITITGTEVDGSATNEAQTLSAGGTTSPTVTLSTAGGAGGGTVTLAGAGDVTLNQSGGTITITGTEVDGSVTNEAQSLSAGGTTSPTVTLSTAGGAGGGTVTYAGAGIVTLGQSGGTITITGTEVDGSTTNELQTISAAGSGPTSYTVDLSNGGGSVTLTEGANVDLSRTGNTITIAATSGGGTDLTFSGASSPVTLNSNTGTDVTITAGGINTLSATSGNVTITATEVDGSVTNEAQTLSAGGTTSPTVSLSTAGGAGGGTVTYSGSGIVTLSQAAGTISIIGTEVDGSVTNEAQSLSAGGTTSPTVTLSTAGGAGGGTVTFASSGTVSLSQSAGTITISATDGDASVTNEAQTLSTSGTTAPTIDLTQAGGAGGGSVGLAGSGIVSLNQSGGTITITGTEVDGSVTNEAQSLSAGGTTSPTVTLSQAGGAGGGTVTYAGAGIVTLGQSAGTITITGTEVDGSTSNEIQALTAGGAGPTSYTLDLSVGGGSVTLTESGIVDLSRSGNTITVAATEVDGSVTNEAQTLSAGGTTSPTVTLSTAGGAGGGTVTLAGAGDVTLNQSGGTITITGTEVDGSTTNELQTISAAGSGPTSYTVDLSNGGGSVTLTEGANVDLSRTGNTITIAATSGGGTDLSFSGTSSPVTLNSNTGTDVTITAGGINTLSASAGDITITATEVDGSVTNEAQTLSAGGTTSPTVSLSTAGGAGGGTITYAGAGIVTLGQSAGTITITGTEVDGSTSNELQTISAAGAGPTSFTVDLSNGGGSVTLTESGIVDLSRSGNTITVAATEVDGSVTNEAQTLSAGGTTSPTVTLSTAGGAGGGTVTYAGGGIVTLNQSGGTITITGTEVDGSTTNELQTIAAAGAGPSSYTIDISNGGGSVTLVEGAAIDLDRTGNTITIANTGDASNTNELQAISAGGAGPTSFTVDLSNGGGSVTFAEGGIVDLTRSTNTITVSATEVDGSVTNEAQSLTAGGTTSPTVTLSTAGGAGGGTVTLAGAGDVTLNQSGGTITITGTEVDGSVTNEAQSLSAGGTTSPTVSLSTAGGAGGGTVTYAGAGIVTLGQSGGTITITGTEVDGSTSNEIQSLTAGGAGPSSYTLDLSVGGGSVTLTEGASIDLSRTGNTITIASTATGTTDLTFSGASSPVTLNSSTGTDVTITAGGINTFSATSGNLTITATEVDGSVTNEAQSLSIGGTTSPTITLSQAGGAGGGTATFAGSGIVSLNQSGGTITITGTEVDGSTSNELQTISAGGAGPTSYTVDLSNGGGSVTLAEGTAIDLTRSTNTITITNTGDLSVTNEAQTLSAGGTTAPTINLSTAGGAGGGTVTLNGAGIITLNQSGGTITITGTEVDGSTTNELQTISAAGAGPTSYTLDLSNGGGSVTLAEGAGIDLTRSTNTITIASTAGSTDLAFSGAASPVTLTSSTGTDVTITAGGINTFSATSGNLTITATEVDGSVTNEGSLSVTAGGSNDSQISSNTSGSTAVTIAGGTNVTVTESGSTITIAAAGTATNFASTRGYVEGQTGTTIDLDANDGKTKDVDGTNLAFDIPSNLDNFKVYKNGVLLQRTGTGTTRDYSADASANSVTFGTALVSTDRVIVQTITGSALDLYTSGELTGAGTIGNTLKLAQQSATTGQALKWNGSTWAPDADFGAPSVISPSQITSDQDNYNPTNFGTASLVRISSDAFRAITSFASQSDGEEKQLLNVGSFPIYIPGQHPDGTAANRVITPYDYYIFPGKGCRLIYDNTASRWNILSPKETYRKGLSYSWAAGSTTAGDWGSITLTTSGTGASSGTATATSSVPGATTFSTGTTSTGMGCVSFSKTVTTPFYFSGAALAAEGSISLPALSDGTNTYTAALQITNGPTSTSISPNNTIGIRYTHGTNSGKWQGYSKDNAGTETTVDLGVTVATTTVYNLRIELDKQNTEARFYIDGVMAGRVTANLPNAVVCAPREVIVKSAGTTASTLNCHSMFAEAIY